MDTKRRLALWLQSQVGGDKWGWQRKAANLLGISPNQLNDVLTGRVCIGPALRERIRSCGGDVDYIETGRESVLEEIRLKATIDALEEKVRFLESQFSEEALRNLYAASEQREPHSQRHPARKK